MDFYTALGHCVDKACFIRSPRHPGLVFDLEVSWDGYSLTPTCFPGPSGLGWEPVAFTPEDKAAIDWEVVIECPAHAEGLGQEMPIPPLPGAC